MRTHHRYRRTYAQRTEAVSADVIAGWRECRGCSQIPGRHFVHQHQAAPAPAQGDVTATEVSA